MHISRLGMAVMRITTLCKRSVIYIRLVRVKHLELTQGYMETFFNNGSMTMKLHILKVLYVIESRAKDGRFGLSRNGDIRRYIGTLVEKQTLDCIIVAYFTIYKNCSTTGRIIFSGTEKEVTISCVVEEIFYRMHYVCYLNSISRI